MEFWFAERQDGYELVRLCLQKIHRRLGKKKTLRVAT